MNMEEKIRRQQKIDYLTKTSYEEDIKNKKREVEETRENIQQYSNEIENIKKEKELFAEIAQVMLDNYGKVDGKIDHKWEEQPKYWELMKEKQKLDNKRKLAEYDRTIKQLRKSITNFETNITSLEANIKMTEAEMLEGDKNDGNE